MRTSQVSTTEIFSFPMRSHASECCERTTNYCRTALLRNIRTVTNYLNNKRSSNWTRRGGPVALVSTPSKYDPLLFPLVGSYQIKDKSYAHRLFGGSKHRIRSEIHHFHQELWLMFVIIQTCKLNIQWNMKAVIMETISFLEISVCY